MLLPMRLIVGTSGYSYKEWKGTFYPEDLPAAKMLSFYAQHFDSVEINNTFYRMPEAKMLGKWATEVPDGFTFVLKAPQRITHQKRLVGAGGRSIRRTSRRRRCCRSTRSTSIRWRSTTRSTGCRKNVLLIST